MMSRRPLRPTSGLAVARGLASIRQSRGIGTHSDRLASAREPGQRPPFPATICDRIAASPGRLPTAAGAPAHVFLPVGNDGLRLGCPRTRRRARLLDVRCLRLVLCVLLLFPWTNVAMPCCDEEPGSVCCEAAGNCPVNAAGNCILETAPPPAAPPGSTSLAAAPHVVCVASLPGAPRIAPLAGPRHEPARGTPLYLELRVLRI